jgi:phage shock protein PspC (stress-responsive transcriptional regulator)
MQVNRRRLYRCSHDQQIAGVAAGVAEYLDLDATLVRVLWVLSIFFGGLGLLLYVVMAIIVPLEPEALEDGTGGHSGAEGPTRAGDSGADAGAGSAVSGAPAGWRSAPTPHRHAKRSGIGMTFFGIVLVLFGALALVDQLLPMWADQGRFLWPAFILAIGVLLVATSMRRHPNQP